MNIVTASDNHCARFLPALARSVELCYGKPLVVYNMGLSPEKLPKGAMLLTPPADCGDWNDYIEYKRGDQKCRGIKTTHKPIIIKDALQFGRVLYVDADTYFKRAVDLQGFDVGVCLKPVEDRYMTGDKFSSYINAGVMVWNTNNALLEAWTEKCKEDTTDQKAITDLLSKKIDWDEPDVLGRLHNWNGVKVRVLDCRIYNDYKLDTGDILHFKGELQNRYDTLIKEIE